MELAQAEIILNAARKKANALGLPMCIAVVDAHAYLVAFFRVGDTTLDSIQIAIDKGYTSAVSRTSTRELGRLCQAGEPLFGYEHTMGGRLIIFGGGFPLWNGKEFFGAIGVSGGLVDEDEEVAKAGMAAAEELFSK